MLALIDCGTFKEFYSDLVEHGGLSFNNGLFVLSKVWRDNLKSAVVKIYILK